MPTAEEKFVADLHQHLASRNLRETAEEQEVKFKKLLLDDLTEIGEETPEGHFVYTFENGHPVLGVGVVSSVKREKRAPLKLDPDAVDKLLPPEHHDTVYQRTITLPGLSEAEYEAVMDAIRGVGLIGAAETEEVIDEDALLALNYEGVLPDEDMKQMYQEGKVIYALRVNYAKS